MTDGKGLAVAGLIFGIIGAGFGGYIFITNLMEDEPSVSNTWFAYKVGSSTLGDNVYAYIDEISHIVTVNPGEHIYMLFTCYLVFSSTAATAFFGIQIDQSSVTYYIITRTTSGTERIPISMQYGEYSVSPGSYNISVWCYATIANQECYRASLLVQTYK